MKSIFEETTREELIERIQRLDGDSEARWGTMDVNQMVRHCIRWEEVTQGKRQAEQSLLARLFGKLILKGFVKDDSPLKRYLPAVKEIKVTESVPDTLSSDKSRWMNLITEYPELTDHSFEVPFFGAVDQKQAGYLAYKHSDHHLRQFGV
jgi:hypothetical protein